MEEGTLERIAVIGCSGAGKSTLARALAEATGLPLIHLDREHWLPGWTEPDADEWRTRAAGFAARPRWIIDGLYGSTVEPRLKRATAIVYLDLPTWVCVAGIVRRVVGAYGRVRPDMGDGCPEQFDLGFLRWVVGFPRQVRPRLERAVAASDARVVRITSVAQRSRFLRTLGEHGPAVAMASPG